MIQLELVNELGLGVLEGSQGTAFQPWDGVFSEIAKESSTPLYHLMRLGHGKGYWYVLSNAKLFLFTF